MRKISRLGILYSGAILLNILIASAAQAHSLAALHAHTPAGAIAMASTAVACLCVVGLIIKRVTRKSA